MVRVSQIKLPITHTEKDMLNKVSKELRISENDILSTNIYRRSLDARKKNDIHYSYIIDVKVKDEKLVLSRSKKAEEVKEYEYIYPEVKTKSSMSPIIIGFGPAGLFAAYILSELGLNPVVFERGEDVDSRTKTVDEFWKTGLLNENSNVQYGEGGAGTFSDGKLTTRSKDLRSRKALEILVKHGAPKEILYVNKPHIGTDILKPVVKSMREEIIRLGGKVNFNSKVEDFIIEEGTIKGIVTNEGIEYKSDKVILAIGHSARDTYERLHKRNVKIEQKPFAMGVRIEHHQSIVDENQYGDKNLAKELGAADYKLTHKTSNGRSVYSFCVCPGGMVVASSSEKGHLVVNGMSEHDRAQKNINGALLVQIQTEDFQSDHPLAGVEFQRKYEKLAFELGGSNYKAPVQTVGSFLRGEENKLTKIVPSYKPDVLFTELSKCLPDFVFESLKEGILKFGSRIKGFSDSDSIITGIETRSSAPIRIVRDYTNMESVNIKGLYPIGEGAGYAGGIISSAIDGIKAAEFAIICT